MKTKTLSILLLSTLFFMLSNKVRAQIVTMDIDSVYSAYDDSLRSLDYDHFFPIWGEQAYHKGFDVPYSAGAMLNYVVMKQGINISNFQLGFQPGSGTGGFDLQDADFIKFGKNTNVVNTVTFRPDLWVFPFLNVYGLFGYGRTNTDVNLAGVEFPYYFGENDTQLGFPLDLTANVKQNVRVQGFGLLFAGGLGPLFFTLDANWTWSKAELLEDKIKTQVLGVRLGHVFKNKHKPDKNFGVWVGGMNAQLGSLPSQGSLTINDLLSENAAGKRDEVYENYTNWYGDLNIAQKAIVDRTPIPEIMDAFGSATGDGTIEYRFEKSLQQAWNGIIGAQYQFNKRWMLRSEAGVIGNRKSFMLSLNYRFCI